MDEALKVIRRLDRIEALQSASAPAEELLGEVRQLLAEGEAWLAAEAGVGADGGAVATDEAAAALTDCRTRLRAGREVMPEPPGSRNL